MIQRVRENDSMKEQTLLLEGKSSELEALLHSAEGKLMKLDRR